MNTEKDQMDTLYKKHSIYTKEKMVHVWYGPRNVLMEIIRKFDKSTYDRIRGNEIHYYPAHNVDGGSKSMPHGSYNLFHPTSNKFHLIYEGDYDDPEFVKAIIGYCQVDDIMLPRATGGGSALPVAQRVPIIILWSIDTEDPVTGTQLFNPELTPFVHVIDASTWLDR